jgi:hypothetical protein
MMAAAAPASALLIMFLCVFHMFQSLGHSSQEGGHRMSATQPLGARATGNASRSPAPTQPFPSRQADFTGLDDALNTIRRIPPNSMRHPYQGRTRLLPRYQHLHLFPTSDADLNMASHSQGAAVYALGPDALISQLGPMTRIYSRDFHVDIYSDFALALPRNINGLGEDPPELGEDPAAPFAAPAADLVRRAAAMARSGGFGQPVNVPWPPQPMRVTVNASARYIRPPAAQHINHTLYHF